MPFELWDQLGALADEVETARPPRDRAPRSARRSGSCDCGRRADASPARQPFQASAGSPRSPA